MTYPKLKTKLYISCFTCFVSSGNKQVLELGNTEKLKSTGRQTIVLVLGFSWDLLEIEEVQNNASLSFKVQQLARVEK